MITTMKPTRTVACWVLLLVSAVSQSHAQTATGEPGGAAASGLRDIRIADTAVFPESLTSTRDGTVFAGSIKGIVYRADPGADVALPWIEHSETNGILSILGVLADENSNTLWLCSVPNFFGPERSQGVSALIAFDLDSGDFKGRHDLPPPASACNDISIAPNGAAYISDTPNGRLLVLDPGAADLRLAGQDDALVGIDGLAFSGDGTLYVNNVQRNTILRVALDANGDMAGLSVLQLSHELQGPDGFRLIEGRRFLQAESGTGRVGILTIEGDEARLEVLRDDLMSAPGATLVGDTVYVIDNDMRYLFDPALSGQDHGPFILKAIPL